MTDDEHRAAAIKDLIESKAVRRNLSLKIFDWGKVEPSGGNKVRQVITLRRGLNDELAKKISKLIREEFPKVKPQIQGDAVRVSGKSSDELQQVIGRLRELEECRFRSSSRTTGSAPMMPGARYARVLMIVVAVVVVLGLVVAMVASAGRALIDERRAETETTIRSRSARTDRRSAPSADRPRPIADGRRTGEARTRRRADREAARRSRARPSCRAGRTPSLPLEAGRPAPEPPRPARPRPSPRAAEPTAEPRAREPPGRAPSAGSSPTPSAPPASATPSPSPARASSACSRVSRRPGSGSSRPATRARRRSWPRPMAS